MRCQIVKLYDDILLILFATSVSGIIEMKQEWIEAYMDTAERFAQLSHARRLKVGAVVVKDNRIISIGYNGTPSGWENNCEDELYTYDDRDIGDGNWTFDPVTKKWTTLKTKPEVMHAEANAVIKLAKSNESGEGSYLFCTHAPCIECAKLIYGAGIKAVYFRGKYKNDLGVEFLRKSGVQVSTTDLKDF
jgi:dCMP deaminase